jgi:hypothetical protein
MRLKRLIIVSFALLLLCLVFLNTWQGYRYESLEADVRRLEGEQKDWLERNKKVIAGLAVLSSPERVARLARASLQLRKLAPGQRVKVVFDLPGERPHE